MYRLQIILLSLLLSLSAYAGVTKADADALYQKEQYQKAAGIYEKILKEQGVAPEIYYNLGGCYYKMDEIPLAVLNYERALLLSPGDADIRANLALARGKTVDKVTPASQMFFVTWWYDLVHSMAIQSWTVLALGSFILALVCLILYFFSSDMRMQKSGFYLAILLVLICILSNLSAYSQYSQLSDRRTAIIMTPTVSVKSSPSATSTDLFVIHEGSKVEILDKTMNDWREVKFEEGKQGWIPTSDLEEI